MRTIAYRGSIAVFRRVVLPALYRAGMVGLSIMEHPAKVQAMVESALRGDPEYVRSLICE